MQYGYCISYKRKKIFQMAKYQTVVLPTDRTENFEWNSQRAQSKLGHT